MPLFFKFALEPSILIGNISYALTLVLSLYKKKSSKNNILYFSLHFLIIFVLEFVLTGTFIYIKWPNFSYSFYLKYFLVSLLYLVPINFFDNKSSMRSKIAIALSIYAMHFTLGELGGGIPVLFQNVNYGKTLDTIIRNFCTISLIFFGLFINRFNLKKIKKIPSIAIIFICTYSVLEIILSYYSTTRFQARSFNTSLFQVLVFLVISIINYLSYYMIYTICNKNDQFIQLQAKAFELEKNKELIAISDENLQKLREIKHDTKNQYACMKMLLENKQYDELNKFFDSYGDGIIEPISFISCDNKMISSILNMEYAKAKANKVDFDVKLAVSNNLNIESIDLSSLISNLLDNAIEACLYYKINNPIINIRMREYKGYLIMEIKNPVAEGVRLDLLKKIKTTKKDKSFHGYGIKIIKEIVKKYDGVFERKIENNIYCAKLMIKKGENNNEN